MKAKGKTLFYLFWGLQAFSNNLEYKGEKQRRNHYTTLKNRIDEIHCETMPTRDHIEKRKSNFLRWQGFLCYSGKCSMERGVIYSFALLHSMTRGRSDFETHTQQTHLG